MIELPVDFKHVFMFKNRPEKRASAHEGDLKRFLLARLFCRRSAVSGHGASVLSGHGCNQRIRVKGQHICSL